LQSLICHPIYRSFVATLWHLFSVVGFGAVWCWRPA
jgi:hypothetical protein